MYLPDPAPLLAAVAGLLTPGGLLSLLVRNGDALAMRPGRQGDWAAAARAFDGGFRNNLGMEERPDRREELTAKLGEHHLDVSTWYGVRVFTDTVPLDEPAPTDPAVLALLLECEERAGRADPYRAVAALTHLIATAG